MFKLVLEKAEEPEIKLPTSTGSLKKQESSRKTSAAAAAAKSLQSRPTLCDPIDGSPPGSPVAGILQARTLEWVAITVEYYSTIEKNAVMPFATTRVDLGIIILSEVRKRKTV